MAAATQFSKTQLAPLQAASKSGLLFFFKQKTAYEIDMCWSSDVCSSDLHGVHHRRPVPVQAGATTARAGRGAQRTGPALPGLRGDGRGGSVADLPRGVESV